MLMASESLKIFTTKASFYHNKFEGRKTASGDLYRKDSLTCAANKYPLGTVLKITNVKNDSVVIVRVNDRISKKFTDRIDLSRKAMSLLDGIKAGIIQIKIEIL